MAPEDEESEEEEEDQEERAWKYVFLFSVAFLGGSDCLSPSGVELATSKTIRLYYSLLKMIVETQNSFFERVNFIIW